MTEWHKGPPPEIGWWPASAYKDAKSIRWWNGEYWSVPTYKTDSAELAGRCASQRGFCDNREILWAERWWLK